MADSLHDSKSGGTCSHSSKVPARSVSNIVSQTGTAATGGLRIDEQGDQFAVTVAEVSTQQEVIVEDHGARVFLSVTVADVRFHIGA